MTFANIIGHQKQIDLLRRALATDRLGQAYLFHGPEGVGKRLVALSLARAVFCPEGGCGVCPSCRKVDHHNHPDLHLLEPDGAHIKIDQVRDLQRELSLRPLEANRKIALVDHAELMNPAAGNSFLKTLEEPPGDSIIIMVTAFPEKLLSTIRSRCQGLPFHRLPRKEIERALHQRLGLEGTDTHILAALSDGSFHRAFGDGRSLYLEERGKLIKGIAALSGGSVAPLLDLAEQLSKEKETLDALLEIVLCFYRDLLLVLHGRPETDLVNIDLLDLLQRLAATTSIDAVLAKLSSVLRTMALTRRNVNRQLALEIMLLDLAA